MKLLKIGNQWINADKITEIQDVELRDGTGQKNPTLNIYLDSRFVFFTGDERAAVLQWLDANSEDVTVGVPEPTSAFKVGDHVVINNTDSVYHLNVGTIIRNDKNAALNWAVSFGPNDEDYFTDDEMKPVDPAELDTPKPATLKIGDTVTFYEGDTGKVVKINPDSNYPYGVKRADGSITWVRAEIAEESKFTGKFKVDYPVFVEPRKEQGTVVSVLPDAHKPYVVRFYDKSESGFDESELDFGIPF